MTKNFKKILYITLSILLIVILMALFDGPISNKINAYRENVLLQSEEECTKDDAPFWCNL